MDTISVWVVLEDNGIYFIQIVDDMFLSRRCSYLFRNNIFLFFIFFCNHNFESISGLRLISSRLSLPLITCMVQICLR